MPNIAVPKAVANTIKAVVSALIEPMYLTPYISAQVDDPRTLQRPFVIPINPKNTKDEKGLSDKDVTDLKNVAGGEKKYDQIVDWATKNLSEQEQSMYDAVVDRGDPLACYFALQTVMAKYENAVGVEGKMITGKPPTQNGNVFRSQAELVQAMADPRYENDPAYRQDVIQKLDRSGVNF